MNITHIKWVQPSLLLILVCLLISIPQGTLQAADQPAARAGVLNLQNWQPTAQPSIQLNGEWEFHWMTFVPPGSSPETITKSLTGYADIPTPWNKTEINGQSYPIPGYASYRLLVLLPANLPELLLEVRQLTSAYHIYVNGQLIGSNGTLGKTIHTSRPSDQVKQFNVPGFNGEIEILIHVSNFHFTASGFRRPIILMEESFGRKALSTESFRTTFLSSVILVIGFYHVLFFFLDKRTKITFIFGLICLMLALQIEFTTNMSLGFLSPFLDGELQKRLKYFFSISVMFLFFPYIIRLFEEFQPERLLKISFKIEKYFAAISLICAILMFVMPLVLSRFPGYLMQWLTTAYIPFLMLHIFLAFRAKAQGSRLFLIAGIILVGVFTNDFLHFHSLIQTAYLIDFGAFGFVAIQAIILARRYATAFTELEVVSAERAGLLTRLEEYSRELEEKVQQRTEELTDANDALHEAVVTKDKFFSIIAHDLRGPIGTVDTMIQQLHPSELAEKETMEHLRTLSKRSYGLLENLLLWASSQSGRLQPVPQNFNLDKAFDSELPMLRETANQKQVLLDVNIPTNIEIYADLPMVMTILRNLVSNAIKYTYKDGKVSVLAEQTDKIVEITVKDTGIGMDKKELENIFAIEEKNVPVPGTANESGTGLGLILSNELVEKNGGKITAKSALNQGSEFTVTLPAKPNNAFH